MAQEMMTVHEVAAFLNVKERKVYDLVKRGQIPCSRVTGKWLFPRHLVEQWVARNTEFAALGSPPAAAPPVVAGSHDPLLEWALRESRSDLAMLAGGSLDGLKKLAEGEAQVCGVHLLHPEQGDYNVWAVLETIPGGHELVMLTWAWRRQGLVVAPGNPLGLKSVQGLAKGKVRFVARQPEAGTQVLLAFLLAQHRIAPGALQTIPEIALSQTEVGLAVLEGRADAGLGVEAAARQLKLDFVPLHRERYDLVVGRRDYFDPPFQKLLAFTRTPAFAERARRMGGYEIETLGTVVRNGF